VTFGPLRRDDPPAETTQAENCPESSSFSLTGWRNRYCTRPLFRRSYGPIRMGRPVRHNELRPRNLAVVRVD